MKQYTNRELESAFTAMQAKWPVERMRALRDGVGEFALEVLSKSSGKSVYLVARPKLDKEFLYVPLQLVLLAYEKKRSILVCVEGKYFYKYEVQDILPKCFVTEGLERLVMHFSIRVGKSLQQQKSGDSNQKSEEQQEPEQAQMELPAAASHPKIQEMKQELGAEPGGEYHLTREELQKIHRHSEEVMKSATAFN